MQQHGIVDQTFEDVQTARTCFRRRQRLKLVFILVGQAIKVVIRATDGFTRLATHPIVEVQLARWVNGVLNNDGNGLPHTRCACMTFLAVDGVCAEHQRGVAVKNQANGVVVGVGVGGAVLEIHRLDVEHHATGLRFNGRGERHVVRTKGGVDLFVKHAWFANRLTVKGHVLANHPE